MAPPMALKKLVVLQLAREQEIESVRSRLAAKPRESLTRNIVESRLYSVKEIWIEARKTHSEILVRDDVDTGPYVIEKWFDRIQGVYENAVDECLTLLAAFERAANATSPVGMADASFSETNSTGVAKLPRIPLPSFSGKYEDWDSFCDLFTTLVHDAPRLSDATKLQYLKSCLTGRAADLIKDVTTTSANYLSTWKALKARYYNPRLIINKHLTTLVDIPRLKRESASEPRSFIDEAQRIVRALTNLQLPVGHWDVWLVFVLSERFDPESRKLWESELSERDSRARADENSVDIECSGSLPKFSDFVRFVEKRAQALGMITSERRGEKRHAPTPPAGLPSRKVFHASAPPSKSGSFQCSLCYGAHSLAKCFKFKGKAPHERLAAVKQLRACFNCLGQHRVNDCLSSGRCSICQRKHHTLIHSKLQNNIQTGQQTANEPKDSRSAESISNAPVVGLHASSLQSSHRKVILATARVRVIGPDGDSTYVRALLDQGSESSFVSESIVQLLRLPKQRTSIILTGLGANPAGTARTRTRFELGSTIVPEFRLKTDALVLPKLTSHLPADSISDFDLRPFEELSLADPEFLVSARVDLILGADVYGQLLRSGLKRSPTSKLVAQNTAFGWIISGSLQMVVPRRAERSGSPLSSQVLHCSSCDLDKSLQQFWTIEEIPEGLHGWKPEDRACEKLFEDTHSRDSLGRYEVRLPLKTPLPSAGAETRRMALGSLSSIQRRLSRDRKLLDAYCNFMQDYERLGHMSKVPSSEIHSDDAWYLPRHAVVSASSNKIRVVFDASRRTRDGQSLNDFLLTGPALQGDLSLTLLNWRRYPFAFTADIVKMFRQIQVKPVDRDFQRIVWSPTIDSNPVDYRLNTVTCGTACAPYLAIRTLQQLVRDEGDRFPLGAECLQSETYVDDTFAGADDLPTAVKKRGELTSLLGLAGIGLDKWAANHVDLVPPQAQQNSAKLIESDSSVKTLGVQWNPSQDQFSFRAENIEELSTASTKRGVLSSISRLFDPLGWLAPITVTAKVLMQDLWLQKCDWDTPLPLEFRERWYSYCRSLSALPSLSVERWREVTSNRSYQIHGFSDASSRAYSAVVYLRVDTGDGRFHVAILAAKSKVAPVKTIRIPNLELCGAVLLAKLVRHIQKLNHFSNLPVFAWSDSEIVLVIGRRS